MVCMKQPHRAKLLYFSALILIIYDSGGFRMPHLQTFISTLKLVRIRRLFLPGLKYSWNQQVGLLHLPSFRSLIRICIIFSKTTEKIYKKYLD